MIKKYGLLSFLSLVLLLSGCGSDEEVENIENIEDIEISEGEVFVAEINLARAALAGGEESWDNYMAEVVEPTLEYIYGGNRHFIDAIDNVTGTNMYLELKNAYKNGKMQGHGSSYTATIPQSDFKLIEPVIYSEELTSGSKKWTDYFVNNDVTDYHGDFKEIYDISDSDEKGNLEVVCPKFKYYDTARAAVVAWLWDKGNISRGHRIILLGKNRKFAGGYVNTVSGGATARLTFN